MGDEEKAEIFLAAKLGQQGDDFRLDGGIERGGGFVGNHHSRRASQRLGNQDALCFSAAQLVRISVENAARVRQLDLSEQCRGFVAQTAPTPTVMGAQDFGDLRADAQNRIQRQSGLLKNNGDGGAAQAAHLTLTQSE